MIRAVVVVIAFLLASAGAQQQVATIGPAAQVHPVPENYRFPDGETLHYSAEWRIWQAGVATLSLDQAGSEQRITAVGSSTGFVALLFRASDTFVSRFNPHTFCSAVFTKHTEEGLHKRETTIRFDEVRRRAVLDERNLRDNGVKHIENEIPSCATDVLNGIYYLRTLPLQVGATYLFPLNNGGPTVDVKSSVEGNEDIKTDAGTFHTVRVSINSDADKLKGRGKVWIWYTDDASHVPVQMRSQLFWGTLTLRLVRVGR
jgi:hypothetical protein